MRGFWLGTASAGRGVLPDDQIRLKARPVHHHDLDNIEAHITIVFAALTVARCLQQATGWTIKRLVKRLRPLRSAVIHVNNQTLIAPLTIDPEITKILDLIDQNTGHQPIGTIQA